MRMNITSVALTWLLAAQLAQADDPINVSKTGTVLSDEVLYSIGGGSAVSMGSAGQMDSIGVGFGWNNDMMCGNMNLSTTLENQLNGATQGFQNIMGSVIQNATRRGHVAAGVDHPAREPSALQPDHQWHPAGADRLRPLERDLQSDRREDG
ncbi:putative integral membrane protein [Pseudomonas aeruginosa]|nr:putative integral membrane protein [Pseudomonas aeruginosa]